jgi:hypothetical protein
MDGAPGISAESGIYFLGLPNLVNLLLWGN